MLDLLPALRARRIDVEMCVLGAGEAHLFTENMQNAGVKTTVIPAGPDLNPILIPKLVSQIRRFRPDLVHTHLIHADVHGQLAARLAGKPAVSSMHSTVGNYRKLPYRWAAARAGHSAKKTIAISGHVGRFLEELGIAPAERIRVIPYGIDAAQWNVTSPERARIRGEFGVETGVIAVGVASRLFPGKGHDVLIDAFARSADQFEGSTLLIAGDGSERSALEGLSGAKACAGRVRFLGFVADMRGFMNACDIFVFPSQPVFGEGFGLAALEAMAAGLPVIATGIDSLPEIVVHEETGLLVSPADPDGLARAIVRLSSSDSFRKQLGAAARRRAMESFGLDLMVEKTIDVYREAI